MHKPIRNRAIERSAVTRRYDSISPVACILAFAERTAAVRLCRQRIRRILLLFRQHEFVPGNCARCLGRLLQSGVSACRGCRLRLCLCLVGLGLVQARF